MKWKIACYSAILLWLFCTCACLLTMSSCTSTRIVTVPEYHEVFVHRQDTTSLRDSIFVHDSICIVQRGDTVFIEKYNIVYRDRWRDRLRVDSFIQRDTITVVKEVEKPPNRWQLVKQRLGSTLLWMVAAAAIFFLIRIIINKWKVW